MSWDVFIMNVPADIVSATELPDDFSGELGSPEYVLAKLASIFPSINLTDPTWGGLDTEDGSIEFNIGSKDPIKTMMLHARGGNSVIGAIQMLCDQTGWRALDMTTGDFINFENNPAEGLKQWRSYKDKVIASYETKKWWQFWK